MANKIQNAFDNVKADSQLKEYTKQYLSVQRRQKSRPLRRTVFPKALAAVCAVLILISGIGSYSWILTPVSYVSIDINPSIELALNRLNRVVSVTAYNDKGAELIAGLSVKGKKYTEAINAVTDSDFMKEYLAKEGDLVFTIAAGSTRRQELTAGVKSCYSHIRHKCRSVSADLDIVSDAHDNGMSLGKYQAYLILSKYDDTVTVHQCKEMSMSEIHGQILEHEHGDHDSYGHNIDTETDTGQKAGTDQSESDTGQKAGTDQPGSDTGCGKSDTERTESDAAGTGHNQYRHHGGHGSGHE